MSIWLKIRLVLNLLGAGQGLFLSLLFFSKKNGNHLSNRILGFLLLAFVTVLSIPDSNLTVKMLAKILNLPERHISQVINQELEQNFQDFMNYYRIEEVKRRLTSPDYYHLTLMGIANETGFKSSSTFNQAFKKHTGLLPSVYRKSLQKEY